MKELMNIRIPVSALTMELALEAPMFMEDNPSFFTKVFDVDEAEVLIDTEGEKERKPYPFKARGNRRFYAAKAKKRKERIYFYTEGKRSHTRGITKVNHVTMDHCMRSDVISRIQDDQDTTFRKKYLGTWVDDELPLDELEMAEPVEENDTNLSNSEKVHNFRMMLFYQEEILDMVFHITDLKFLKNIWKLMRTDLVDEAKLDVTPTSVSDYQEAVFQQATKIKDIRSLRGIRDCMEGFMLM